MPRTAAGAIVCLLDLAGLLVCQFVHRRYEEGKRAILATMPKNVVIAALTKMQDDPSAADLDPKVVLQALPGYPPGTTVTPKLVKEWEQRSQQMNEEFRKLAPSSQRRGNTRKSIGLPPRSRRGFRIGAL